jgi:hypothetical protein
MKKELKKSSIKACGKYTTNAFHEMLVALHVFLSKGASRLNPPPLLLQRLCLEGTERDVCGVTFGCVYATSSRYVMQHLLHHGSARAAVCLVSVQQNHDLERTVLLRLRSRRLTYHQLNSKDLFPFKERRRSTPSFTKWSSRLRFFGLKFEPVTVLSIISVYTQIGVISYSQKFLLFIYLLFTA